MKNRELRKKAEEKVKTNDINPEDYDKQELSKIIHELQVHQIEMELQNEELRKSEQYLTETKRKYTNLYDFAPVGYLTLDEMGIIREVNLTGSIILEMERGFLIGKPFTIFIGADANDHFYQYLNLVKYSDTKQIWNTYINTTKKKKKYIRLETTSFIDKKNNKSLFRAIMSDTTDKKEMEDELELTKLKLNMSLFAGRIAWWVWDYPSGYVDYAELKAEMLGYSSEEFGHDVYEICNYIHPEDYDSAMQSMREHLEGKTDIYEIEYRIRKKDGSYIWYYDRGKVVKRDENGKPVKITGVVFDISERKRYEEVLKNDELRFRQLADATNEGILFHDEGIIVDMNKSLAELIGYEDQLDKVIGRYILEFIDEKYHEITKQNMHAEYDESIEIEILHQNGDHILVEVFGRPFKFMGKNVRVVTIRDIREKKADEAKILNLVSDLEKTNADLEKSLEKIKKFQNQIITQEKLASLGMIAAGISHEIKNPLNFINNFAEINVGITNEIEDIMNKCVQKDQSHSEEIIQFLEDIKNNSDTIIRHGQKANDIIHSMLSQVRTGEVEWANIILNNLINEFFQLTYHGWLSSHPEMKVKYHLNLDPELGEIYIIGQDISRVFVNLINNAFYAMFQKLQTDSDYKPEFNISTERRTDTVLIKISDNGVGIPKDVQSQIFTPFFTTKPSGDGTGLGLSICYDIIVNEHGGNIKFNSEEGKYTEFIISIPLGKDIK